MDQLRDGAIDVMCISMTAPTPAVVEMSTFKKIYLIPMDRAVAEKIASEDGRLSVSRIPKNVYGRNQVNTEDVITLDLVVALGTTIETPESTVYKITKAFWEHLDEFHAVSATAKFVQPETALNALPTPLHPGAEKYYREIGKWPLKK
jgi:TRAP transporter TAXI family solute receptor